MYYYTNKLIRFEMRFWCLSEDYRIIQKDIKNWYNALINVTLLYNDAMPCSMLKWLWQTVIRRRHHQRTKTNYFKLNRRNKRKLNWDWASIESFIGWGTFQKDVKRLVYVALINSNQTSPVLIQYETYSQDVELLCSHEDSKEGEWNNNNAHKMNKVTGEII